MLSANFFIGFKICFFEQFPQLVKSYGVNQQNNHNNGGGDKAELGAKKIFHNNLYLIIHFRLREITQL